MRILSLAALLALPLAAASAAPPPPSAWTVGPIVYGVSRSPGLPLRPQRAAGGAIAVAIPPAPYSLHGLTFAPGSLAGKRRIVMRYRVEAAPGTALIATSDHRSPGIITLFLQRRGDDWSAQGLFETYRWYATFATQTLRPGAEQTMVAPLNANWTAVMTSSARTRPAEFRAALADASAVGVVLGGGDGFGHGVEASAPARLVITDFRIE
ncbi:hypothetical protein [Sphingomonas astaxanthinifaciens]|uniref:DUF3047 domain-containing protein n=1 Tax=Sphingomonas astaxanthinifaciens DSM 22298 TaxID=1123267 RepID=A0ABQ5ZB82_9SPHN|nr:hypothetical protein [Sphingomonas astaxanthinifaciens]GLR48039.1 hypothetical protein GCM10007925_17520 [Sphingomonas astaxanthinifaciens DSM 22298]